MGFPHRRRRQSRNGRRSALAMVLVAGLAMGCQPIDELPAGPIDPPVADVEPGERLGAPRQGLPGSLEELLARAEAPARQWQDEPVVAEITVTVDGQTWASVVVTYLAPDAERLLTVTVDSEGTSVRRATLATLDLRPVPEQALAEVPPFPRDAQSPASLVEAAGPALAECGVHDAAAAVLYTSGAPFAWDGQRWTQPPAWTAVVLTEAGAGVRVDLVSGQAHLDTCVPPEPDET